MTDWQRQFLVTDVAQMRKNYAASRMMEEYRAFLEHAKAVDQLAEACAKLVIASKQMEGL